MILYQPPQNRSWKPLRGKALRLLIFNTSAVERQRFERKAIRPYPPALSLSRERAALEDISPVAPWEVAQPELPVKGAEHRRAAAALPLTGSPGCAIGWRGDGGYIQQSLRGGSGENGRVPSGHGVQKIYKNTAPIFVGSDVLRKVDSPLNCCVFVCSC